jgi:four helix bundle protein
MSGGTLIDILIRMGDTTAIISERAFEFGSRILKLGDRIYPQGPSGRLVATQLMDCGTSVGANAEEAEEAQSKADFIAKLSISRKEARESSYWLRMAVKNAIVRAEDVEWELSETRQLLAMIRSAIRTARSSPDRGGY